ncbi:MAG: uL15 family ribosomal protein [Candidatus ainarchaeum sp.]|nr:uL15 family ribosomal protein [Candidatus ainarchaeum sp.]MDD3975768.1 uL15 family ribosomal protein [Candidatus ainarchaeum sp.]
MSKSKTDRLRGKRTFGKGNTKNNRGGGSTGGRGRGGSFKHKFGKFSSTIGIKVTLKPKNKLKTITLKDLSLLIKDSKEINLKNLGYDKVLGTGNINKSVVIKNAKFTETAKAKIEAAGGKFE